jgi:hypothetical protein
MTKDKDWISIQEAIEHVMKVEGCSRSVARTKLAQHAKKGQLPYRHFLKPANKDRDMLCISLAEFKSRTGFSEVEMLRELRSGRLTASASDETFFDAEVTGKCNAKDFVIPYQALLDWMEHPNTPAHLIARFQNTVLNDLRRNNDL